MTPQTTTRTGRLRRTVALPPERHDQLVRLAQQRGQTITDVIGSFLDREVAEGRLSAEIEGVSIVRENGEIRMNLGPVEVVAPEGSAHQIAQALRENADRAFDRAFGRETETKEERRARLEGVAEARIPASARRKPEQMKAELEASLPAKIGLRGTGVRIEGADGQVHTFDPGIARSVATLIDAV